MSRQTDTAKGVYKTLMGFIPEKLQKAPDGVREAISQVRVRFFSDFHFRAYRIGRKLEYFGKTFALSNERWANTNKHTFEDRQLFEVLGGLPPHGDNVLDRLPGERVTRGGRGRAFNMSSEFVDALREEYDRVTEKREAGETDADLDLEKIVKTTNEMRGN